MAEKLGEKEPKQIIFRMGTPVTPIKIVLYVQAKTVELDVWPTVQLSKLHAAVPKNWKYIPTESISFIALILYDKHDNWATKFENLSQIGWNQSSIFIHNVVCNLVPSYYGNWFNMVTGST